MPLDLPALSLERQIQPIGENSLVTGSQDRVRLLVAIDTRQPEVAIAAGSLFAQRRQVGQPAEQRGDSLDRPAPDIVHRVSLARGVGPLPGLLGH